MRRRKETGGVLRRLLTANTLEELFRGSPEERAVTLEVLEDLSGSRQKYSELARRLAKREGVSYQYVLDRAMVFIASISEVRSKDLFRQLGVPPSASLEEIRKRWRRLVKEIHPDSTGGDSEAFRLARHAYETLANPDRRARYDRYWVREVAPVEQALVLARAASLGRADRIKKRAAGISREVVGLIRRGSQGVLEWAMVMGAGFARSLPEVWCRVREVAHFFGPLVSSLSGRVAGFSGWRVAAHWRRVWAGRAAGVELKLPANSNGRVQTLESAPGNGPQQSGIAATGEKQGRRGVSELLVSLVQSNRLYAMHRAAAGAAVFSLAFVLTMLFTRGWMPPLPGGSESKGVLEEQGDFVQSSPGLLTELLLGPRSVLDGGAGDRPAQSALARTGLASGRTSGHVLGKMPSRREGRGKRPVTASARPRPHSGPARPRSGAELLGGEQGASRAAGPRSGTSLASIGQARPLGSEQMAEASAKAGSSPRSAGGQAKKAGAKRRIGGTLARQGPRLRRGRGPARRAVTDSVAEVKTVEKARGALKVKASEGGHGSGNPAAVPSTVAAVTVREAREFIERFRRTYERLDAGAIGSLFASEATENDVSGQESIAAAYRKAFSDMKQARYSLGKAKVDLLGAWAAVSAPFRIGYRDVAGRHGELEGTVQWWLVRDGRNLKVLRLEYEMGKWPRSLLAAER